MGTLAMSKSIGTRASALRRVATILRLATITSGAQIDIGTDKLRWGQTVEKIRFRA